jgi:hypothetical protein
MENNAEDSSAVKTTSADSQSMKTSEKAAKLTKSPKVKMIGIATATFLLGVVLTSAGALSGIVGKKYSTSELEAAKDVAREEGVSDGYSSGQAVGYKSGLLAGCEYVFTRLDTNDVIKIIYPYNRLSVIAPYWGKSELCK